MQPTYLSWIGYFALINSVDHFVLLDSVQFEKRSWQHRNLIKTVSGAALLSVPVITKGRFYQKINEVELDKEQKFEYKHIKTIEQNYKKTIFYSKYSEELFNLLLTNDGNLSNLNCNLINFFTTIFRINTPITRSSRMNAKGVKDELLFNLCLELGATHYISPPGSAKYLDNSNFFKKSDISYSYFNYIHPQYDQLYGDFLPHMSIIDLLFNHGDRGVEIFMSGINSFKI
jgi:hypothetical protein